MIAYIRGRLYATQEEFVVVDVNGIGYEVLIPHRTAEQLPSLGTEVQFHTCFIVRELSHTLYGFLGSQEKQLFETLIHITGIGPKLALSLIGYLSIEQLYRAVLEKNLTILCDVPGIGKKTAERLLVELKDKLPSLLPQDAQLLTQENPLYSIHAQDAIKALINLGYPQGQAQQAIQKVLQQNPSLQDVPSMITSVLKQLKTPVTKEKIL